MARGAVLFSRCLDCRGGIGGEIVQTVISIRGEWTLILPHREIKYQPSVVLRIGDDSFEAIPFKSEADAIKLGDKLKVLEDVIRKAAAANPDLARANPFAVLAIAVQDLRLQAMVKEDREEIRE